MAAPSFDSLLRAGDWRGGLALARERVNERLTVGWYMAAWGLVLSSALALRLWDLGSRALHHDESLHAYYSWQLFDGRGYDHNPLMHGPLQMELGAISYWLFGAGDFTARVPAALLGFGIVAMIFLLRGHLGRLGALFAAGFVAFSPALLYFSRFDREDIYTAFFTLGMVVGIWRYLAEKESDSGLLGRNLWLYMAGAFMALSFATKETTYLTLAIFLVYLEAMVALDLLAQMRKRTQLDAVGTASFFVWLLLLGWLLVLLWPLATPLRRRLGIDELPAAAAVMLVLGTLAAPQYSGLFQLIGDKVPLIPGNAGGGNYPAETCHPDECALRNISVSVLIILGLYFGLLWKPSVWLIAAGVYYFVYVFTITTFFSNPEGWWTGVWGSTDYWIEQQSVRRGDQPSFYYFMLLPVYEFLPLLFALAGVVWAAVKGSAFTRFLIFWTAASLLAFTLAAEKMPWLTIHMALPIALLAAKVLNDLFERLHAPVSLNVELPFSTRIADTRALLIAGPLLAALAVVVVIIFSASVVGVVLGSLLGLAALATVAWAGSLAGGRALAQTAAAVVGAGLLVFSIRTAGVASFENGDVPVELLVYTQTSPDVPDLIDQIEEMGRATGQGRDIPIYYDDADGRAWPWAWYFRDFRNLRFGSPDKALQGDILLVSEQNVGQLQVDLGQYELAQPYSHRWWFPEEYRPRPNQLGDWMASLFRPSTWGRWRDYYVDRTPPAPLGSLDSVAYFPKGLGVEQPPVEPTVGPGGELIIGGLGGLRGQFVAPAALEVDVEGNLYVADSRNHRIQKFDSEGNFLTFVGVAGGGEGQFNEPWGLAVDDDGNLYVTDTWNHRIQKFDRDLGFVRAWGRPFTAVGEREPEDDEFFGPRDIAIDAEGNILVTDTGNKRVLEFDPDGSFIEAHGEEGSGPGQFNEPVGIAVAPGGDIYVADAWNRRIQHFDADFEYLDEIAVDSWGSEDVADKPYLAVTAEGMVVATDPANGAVLIFDAAGQKVATWTMEGAGPGELARPVGVYVTATGEVYVSDGAGSRVQRLSLSDLTGS